MNRFKILLALAASLGLFALVLGPRVHSPSPTPTPAPVPRPDPLAMTPAANGNGSLLLTVRTSHPYVPAGASQEVFASATLRGVEVEGAPRRPLDLSLVIDRSGSMAGERLADAKRAARELIGKLTENDRLTLIHFGSEVAVLPTRYATAANKELMLRDVDRIEDDGGTNIGAAFAAAERALTQSPRESAVRRILLVSDGEPTEGVTDPDALRSQVRDIKQHGLRVSSIGVGADFNEDLMSSFAELGAGSYGYLRTTEQLAGLFKKDLEQATTVVARDVELSFTLPPETELVEVLGYASSQDGNTVKVAMTDFAAGQEERVVARLRVKSNAAVGQRFELAQVAVRYDDVLTHAPAQNQLALAATVSDSAQQVLAQRDGQASVDAARALSARNLQEAASAVATGSMDKARQLIQQNKDIFREAEAVRGAPSMMKEKASNDEDFNQVFAASKGGAEGRSATAKSFKKDARMGYGHMGSTY